MPNVLSNFWHFLLISPQVQSPKIVRTTYIEVESDLWIIMLEGIEVDANITKKILFNLRRKNSSL